jgi:secretion/DNA translocation related TadE-like protein
VTTGPGGSGEDRGAATVWSLALLSVILLGALLVSAVAQQAIARQRAATAADLAALAAAQSGSSQCAEADRMASANDASLLACGIDGDDVIVQVSVPAPPLVRRVFALVGQTPGDVIGAARAGPPPP